MDNQTRELIENVIAIGVEYGVDIAGAIVLLVVGWTVAGWIRRVIRRTLDSVPVLDETLKPFIANFVRYAVLIFVLIAVLNQFGVQTTSIIAVLAATGLAIGLALQGMLANVASGVMLLFLRPFNVGENVEAGGIAGTVAEIGLFNTEIKSSAGPGLVVPNSKIWDGPITNFSRNPTRRFDIAVGIGYDDDIDGAMALLKGLLTGDDRVLDEPEPLVVVQELGDSAVIINLRAWIRSGDYGATVWDLNKEIITELQATGYSIPFPQRDVHIVSGEAASPEKD
ncbi:MAG TPA: mechanosensitive ion channel [Rhodospirillales bacterium]|jgi:small conductance mechanosensitive channel|nr:mechanosensitive ion channel [Rhodospirillales bacterium]|tara:strand:+ start:354 stop:1199 length:846 start_codon:yes stop_codon:yes gene_type:complete